MSEHLWIVKEYIIPASHRRGLPRGVKDEETARLRLHVKQWIPKHNPSPHSGDATIIFAHGVGSSKESYEVFFDYLVQYYPRIRSIFAIDTAHHGQSYMLNKHVIGDEPDWHDAARDLVHLVNSFQDEMIPPILGISQSWGADYVLMASEIHPRLFDGLILVEPTFAVDYRVGIPRRAMWMMQRADWWPSRKIAREELLKTTYYRRFDPRVFEIVIKHDLRDVTPDDPSFHKLGADPSSQVGLGVTLTTPKAQEVYTMMLDHLDLPGVSSTKESNETNAVEMTQEFFRPEYYSMKRLLLNAYPPILYVWGELSDIARKPPGGPAYRNYLLQTTGASNAGSGGSAKGKVTETWIKGGTHIIPLEKPEDLAKALVSWLDQRRVEWLENESRNKKRTFHSAKINPNWLAKANKL